MTALAPLPQPDLAARATLGYRSPHTRRVYAARIREFQARGLPLTREGVRAWLGELRARGPSVVNQAVKAIKALVAEAEAHQAISPEGALLLVRGLRYDAERGSRAGNWLTLEQARKLLALPDDSVRGRRDRAILALLLGCGLRREELASLERSQWQLREGRAWLIDIRGKGGRVRSVQVPEWVCEVVMGGGEKSERLIPLSAPSIWLIVKRYAAELGVPDLAPHDLRRTFARLSRQGGASLETVQKSLGHASVQTTERYLASTDACNAGDFIDLGAKPCRNDI